LPRMSLRDHPFFSKWSQGPSWNRDFGNEKSVPLLRSMVQQYKTDLHNRVHSHVPCHKGTIRARVFHSFD
jgi:hypothetical protein